jgi:peptidoglycan/LPS O-acetylase OafA/YrhL
VSVWQLLAVAWAARNLLAPTSWNDWDWGRWLFSYSPYAVSLQFGIGVAAQRLSRLPLSHQLTKAASNFGALGLVAVYLLIGTGQTINRYDQALVTSLMTSFILIGALASSIANRFLSGRGLVYLGTISYSLYLFHFLTPDVSFQGQLESFDFSGAAYHVLHASTAFALAVMLATGAYRLVEIPGRRAIRAAADRLLGPRRAPIVVSGQGAPAE